MGTEICPFEYRYGSRELKTILSRENILRKYLLVEKALMDALEKIGYAPHGCGEALLKCIDRVKPSDVDELERRTGHEIASLAILLGEKCGECGKYVHLGATSNDIIDTGWALVLREALVVIKDRLKNILFKLSNLTRQYMDTIMIGRTHGQHALPLTLGFKLANYIYELTRSYERLCEMEKRLVRAKIAGAVGTMAAWQGKGLKVEEIVAHELGLEPHIISTQVAPRDGYAELAFVIAILASQFDRLALELRELARPEIGEIMVGDGEIGSSTMPHKKNPVKAERVSGLARICRGLALSALENIVLLHERDLSNSSLERVLLPHLLLTIDQIMVDIEDVLSKLRISQRNMLRNIELSSGLYASECLMVKLVLKKDIARHEAYHMISQLVDQAISSGKKFLEVVLESRVGELLGRDEVLECFEPHKYLGNYRELIERTLKYSAEVTSRC